jgi:hypothetical protein
MNATKAEIEDSLSGHIAMWCLTPGMDKLGSMALANFTTISRPAPPAGFWKAQGRQNGRREVSAR